MGRDSFPIHYGLHHNNTKQELKASLLQIKEEKYDGIKRERDPNSMQQVLD